MRLGGFFFLRIRTLQIFWAELHSENLYFLLLWDSIFPDSQISRFADQGAFWTVYSGIEGSSPLLRLLDESTSALDSESESIVQVAHANKQTSEHYIAIVTISTKGG